MKLLCPFKPMIITSENGEHVPHLDINEVILFHCNNVKNHYQHRARVLYKFEFKFM